MCGIAGTVAPEGVAHGALERMGRALEHRGPDGVGFLLHHHADDMRAGRSLTDSALSGQRVATVGFAHRRLSIIDLTDASDQPMVDPSGRYALIYNGEVYNYPEIREELLRLGHVFRSSGDTEVVLTAYKAWGPDCVQRFVGMWALAVLDLERGCLFLSRDRFGIKPLFYSLASSAFHFASEIKALLAGGEVQAQPNEQAVHRFMLTGRVDDSDESFFRGILRLPPAHSALVSLDSPRDVRLTRYWSYPSEAYQGSLADAAEEFYVRLRSAVLLHARADVAVGTCLSGGLDSSAIVCLAEKLRGEDRIPRYTHRGFGYVTNDAALSERPFMEEVVRRTSVEMTYVSATTDRAVEIIPTVVRQQDEPFGTASIVVQWFVFEAARRAGIKVMLDGQGADEVLGGYHSYLRMIARGLLRRWRLLRYAALASDHNRLLGSRPLSFRDALGSAVPPLRRLGNGRAPPASAAVMSASLRDGWRRSDEVLYPRSVNEILERAGAVQLPGLLRFEDRNSMAHSLEARVPFLDHRLVEFAFRLPGDYKVHGAKTKHILREGLVGILPEPVRSRRDKVGFTPDPGVTWMFAGRHRDSLLANGTEFEEQWFDSSALARLMDGSDRSQERESILWRAISTKLWLRNNWSEDGAPSPTASVASVPG